MTSLTVFDFESQQVRVVIHDLQPWWVASDVCEVLEIQNVTQAMSKLDEDERSMFNIGRQGSVNIVNEPGLYSLVLTSRKPQAKAFKRWLTHEVIPSIRAHGSYELPQQPHLQPTNPNEIAFPELADFCQKQLALMGLKPELQRIYLLRAMEAQYTVQSPAFTTLLTAAKENCTIQGHHITPTKLGELYAQRHHLDKSILPADINRALEAAGLQRKEVSLRSNGKKRNVWHLTERGEEYGILLLDKASRVDKTVQVVRWLPSVLDEINVHAPCVGG